MKVDLERFTSGIYRKESRIEDHAPAADGNKHTALVYESSDQSF